MAPAGGSSRFRRRNLNFKTHLGVLRESDLVDEPQVDAADAEGPDGQPHVQMVKTGVDEVEERVRGISFLPPWQSMWPTFRAGLPSIFSIFGQFFS